MQDIAEDSRSKYSVEERYAIALEYALTGNVKRTARNNGMPAGTLRQWRKADWWNDMMEMIADEYEDKIRAKLNRVLDKSLSETIDRLENGDPVYDAKRGEVIQMPVKARDAMMISGIGYDKRRVSLNMPTSITESSSKQIDNLAQQFADLAQSFQYKEAREKNSLPGEYREVEEKEEK